MAAKKAAKARRKTKKAQSEGFKKAATDLEAAGELNLTEAEKDFDASLDRIFRSKPK